MELVGVVAVVETWDLGSLEKRFPSMLPGLVVRNESGGDGSPKSSVANVCGI